MILYFQKCFICHNFYISYIVNIKLKSTRNPKLVAIANKGVVTHIGNATRVQDIYRLIRSAVFEYSFG